jgi:hypothetical protein
MMFCERNSINGILKKKGCKFNKGLSTAYKVQMATTTDEQNKMKKKVTQYFQILFQLML